MFGEILQFLKGGLVVLAVESKTMRWTVCVVGIREKKYAYRVLVGKTERETTWKIQADVGD
jgi:hypothetical protein